MTYPDFTEVCDTPLPTEESLIPFLQNLLKGSYRHQVWILLLDCDARPLPILMPIDVPEQADLSDLDRFAGFLRCLAFEFEQPTLVVVFESPYSVDVEVSDRSWLRFLYEACVLADVAYRGPFLLLADTVRRLPIEEFSGIPRVYFSP